MRDQSFNTVSFSTKKQFIPYLVKHNDLSNQHIDSKYS